MIHRSGDSVQDLFEPGDDVLFQEAENEVAMLLKGEVFAPVAAVRVAIQEVVVAVDFDGDAQVSREQIDLGLPSSEAEARATVEREPPGRPGE